MQGDLEIATRFSFLETERDFRCTGRRYDAAHFGNAIVEYESSTLRLRVIKDRSQFFCDFAAPRGAVEWFDQEVVFRDLGEDSAVDALIAQRWSSAEELAESIRARLDRIGELFSDDNYQASAARFGELRHERARKLFGDPVPEAR
jgi:hypothetical protein